MTDYLGPLAFGTSGSYTLRSWTSSIADDSTMTAEVLVTVQGTSADNCAVLIEALAAQLACSGNVYARTPPGVTNPVIYRVTAASPLGLENEKTWLASWQLVKFTLTLADFPSGALTTLYNAQHVDTPGSLSLATLLGTRPPQLDLTIDDDAGTDMHSVWLCLALRAMTGDQTIALTRAHWLVLASSLTWTTMSNGTGANFWGNQSRYTTSASWQTTQLDTSGYEDGPHKLLALAQQAAGIGYVMDSSGMKAVAVTGATPHLVELGDIDLPVSDTQPGTAANLTLYARSNGTDRLDVIGYVLLPLKHGLVSWHSDVASEEIDQFDIGPSGCFIDGVCNRRFVNGDPLKPKILAAHCPELITTHSPTGSAYPADWSKTDAAVSADTNRFRTTGTNKFAWFAATNAATPLIVPRAWYELCVTRDVDSFSAGVATVTIRWQDIDGNTVRDDVLSSVGANDGAPVPLELYAQAPAQAARAQVRLGNGAAGNLTAYWSAVFLRRCPLLLIIVVEDAAGALTNNTHAVHVTVKHTARYESAR